MINRITAITLACLPQSFGFAPPKSNNSWYGVRCRSSSWRLKYNPNDANAPSQSLIEDVPPFSEHESESARKRRMEMVRKLRATFYSDTHPKEDHLKLPDRNTAPKLAYGSSMIHNLPVLTTEDLHEITSNDIKAILPGYQYVWNIHSSQHSHMFHTILAKDEGPYFFACLSEYDPFSDRPQYATLMRICDHRFRDEDGRIVLAVQAMDRLRIKKLSSPYISFQTGDFQIWPENELIREKLSGAFPNEQAMCDELQDTECITQSVDPNSVCNAAIAACAADSYRCRTFEYAPIYLTEKPKGPDDAHSLHSSPSDSKATQLVKEGIKKQEQDESKYEIDYLKVIELANFDALAYRSLIDASAVNAQAIKNFWTHANSDLEQSSFADEEELFAKLANFDDASNEATFTIGSNQKDQFPTDFATFANAPSNEGVAMMEYHLWIRLDELIRLINKVSNSPVPLSSQLLALLPRRSDWPDEFILDEYSKSMLSQTGPVVRIDEITKQNRSTVYDNTGYSSLRRALRLSHSVWLLIDGMAVTGVEAPPSRAEVLAMETIFERLSVATHTLDSVNGVLKRLIPHTKKDNKDESDN